VAGGRQELIWRFDREYAQGDRDAPRDARLAIDVQEDLPASVHDDLLIVVTELLTNAIRHSIPIREGRILLTVRRERDAVRVEVRDPGSGFAAGDQGSAPDREGGYGLLVVDRLSSEWGVIVTDSTLVWSTIAITA
jgi:anti-sigma regulatory factor (Ser/Thr protein kinase)